MRQDNLAAGRRDARQQGRHLDVVGEADDKLIDHASLPDGSGRLRHLRVGRPMADEPAFIERTHLVAAVAAGHHRHVRDVWRVGHRRHGGVDAAIDKLGAHMGVEDRTRFLVHV